MTILRHDFFAVNSGKVKYILSLRLVVILSTCVFHCITDFFCFIISRLIEIVETRTGMWTPPSPPGTPPPTAHHAGYRV